MFVGTLLCGYAYGYTYAKRNSGCSRDPSPLSLVSLPPPSPQSCKEMPAGTGDEALLRDRTLAKVHLDFVEAAVRGCVAARPRSPW